MTSYKAKPVERTTRTPERGVSKSDEQSWARTERVARSRPAAPVRRFSASDGSHQGTAPLQRPALMGGTQDTSNQEGKEKDVKSFGMPTPVIPLAKRPDSLVSGVQADSTASRQNLSGSGNGGSSQDNQDHGLSSTQQHNPSETEGHQGKTVTFADAQDSMGTMNADANQPDVTSSEQVKQAFAVHAEYQNEGPILSPATNSTPDTSNPSSAGKWNDSESRSLPTHIKAGEEDISKGWKTWTIFVDIRDGDKKPKQIVIKLYTESGRRQYERSILPILEQTEPKPLIRVRDGKLDCDGDLNYEDLENYDLECKEPSHDNSRDLEVLAPDVGYLRILANWHLWREQPKLHENSLIFENGVIQLLFPSTDGNDEYKVELPDGSTFHIARNSPPTLPAELQEALSHITTAESQEGVEPKQIKLRPYTPPNNLTMERPPASPSQKSPGLARAEGTIFVHRPAQFTHFRYDPPYTMESFFRLAREKLYPETKGRLKLRLSPSNDFRLAGKLLLPVMEARSSYTTPGEDGDTREDAWRETIVEQWLRPQEDVWAIKVFDSIQVYDGLRDKDKGHPPEHWDVSAFQSRETDGVQDSALNIPPKSIMAGLAKISLELLNIDPEKSSTGILLRVNRERPGEWLHWNSGMTFVRFLLEVLYKIDREAITIYPGDHEEPNDGMDGAVEPLKTVEAMRQVKKRTSIVNDAVKAFNGPRVTRNLAQADGRFNNLENMRIRQPQTTWNEEGTHLGLTPFYAVDALRYTEADMGFLRQDLWRAESEVLMREEACRVCGKNFLKRSGGKDLVRTLIPLGAWLWTYARQDRTAEIKEHYASHKEAEDHAKKCNIPVDHLIQVEFNNNAAKPIPTEYGKLSKHYKKGAEPTTWKAATINTTAADGLASTAAPGRGRRSTAASKQSNEAPPSDPPKGSTDQTVKAKGGRPKKVQTDIKVTESATAASSNPTQPPTTTASKASESSTGKSPRKRGPTAKAKDPKEPSNPDDPANATKPARKTRAKTPKPENEPGTKTEDQQPEAPKKTRAPRKKMDGQSGGATQSQAPAEAEETIQPPSTVPTDTPASSHSPTAEEKKTEDTAQTTEAKAPSTRSTRAKTPKPQNEPATATEDQQPQPPKPTGASEKKTDNQPEGATQSQAPAIVKETTQPPSLALTEPPASALHPPPPEEGTAETAETAETAQTAEPKAPSTRRTRANATITAPAASTTSSPKKRKTPAPKNPSPAKKRKTAQAENEAETEPTLAKEAKTENALPTGAE
ncbi:MAG: hypothetical protein Q9226_005044, partial [Calogaya cf. arnoldii]